MTLGGSARPIDDKRRANPLAALGHGLVGQTDDRESGNAGRQLDLNLDRTGFEAEISDGGDGRGHFRPDAPDAQRWSETPLARRIKARPAWTITASDLRELVRPTTFADMISRQQWRRFVDHPFVEWTLFTFGIALIIVGCIVAPLPGPGGVFFIVPGPRAGAQDQHVGQTLLRPLQALAAQGRPLGRLGPEAPKRAGGRRCARPKGRPAPSRNN